MVVFLSEALKKPNPIKNGPDQKCTGPKMDRTKMDRTKNVPDQKWTGPKINRTKNEPDQKWTGILVQNFEPSTTLQKSSYMPAFKNLTCRFLKFYFSTKSRFQSAI